MNRKKLENINEKKRKLSRIRRTHHKRSTHMPIDDMLKYKAEVLQIPEQESPDFFSLMNKNDMYYLMRDKIELILENSNGIIPVRFIDDMIDEMRKNWLMVILDICGNKVEAYTRFKYHKYSMDNLLMKYGIYEYYSSRLGLSEEEKEIRL